MEPALGSPVRVGTNSGWARAKSTMRHPLCSPALQAMASCRWARGLRRALTGWHGGFHARRRAKPYAPLFTCSRRAASESAQRDAGSRARSTAQGGQGGGGGGGGGGAAAAARRRGPRTARRLGCTLLSSCRPLAPCPSREVPDRWVCRLLRGPPLTASSSR
ncbi:hypothetical protein BKA66DRAFT_438341 [Pyrenochaeta sp. MPI-SDFR-AT-0127]|nr:hypothetical protein BKA66DRAFT_438341 [Pyrenochaeta sp. MPI-SDFR-AT-0127]